MIIQQCFCNTFFLPAFNFLLMAKHIFFLIYLGLCFLNILDSFLLILDLFLLTCVLIMSLANLGSTIGGY